MLRFGLACLFLFLCTAGLASVLDHAHMVVFGPCADAGAAAIYIALMLTAGMGALFTVAGAVAALVRRIRQRS